MRMVSLSSQLSPSMHVLMTGCHKDIPHQWALLHTMKRITVDERTIRLMADFQLKSVVKLMGGEMEKLVVVDSSGKRTNRIVINYDYNEDLDG